MIVMLKDVSTKVCPQRSNLSCLGDTCMAWRWHDPKQFCRSATAENTDAKTEKEAGKKPLKAGENWIFHPHDEDECDPACWVEPQEEANGRRRGFCGLAGIPEQLRNADI